MPPDISSSKGLEAAVLAVAAAISGKSGIVGNSMKIGDNLLVCWGSGATGTIGTGAYSEGSLVVTFPRAFAATPVIVATPSDYTGGVGEYISVLTVSTTGATLLAGHVAAAGSQALTVYWIAIGLCT